MKPDPLENRLRETPLNAPPTAWREAILTTARAAARPAPESEPPARSASSATLREMGRWWPRLREMLWPSPVAWAVLVLLWAPITLANWTLKDSVPAPAVMAGRLILPKHVETLASAQRRLFRELLDSPEPASPAVPPANRPQSRQAAPRDPGTAQARFHFPAHLV